MLVDSAGRIAAVAPRDVLDLGDGVEVRDLGEAIVLPGLINVHAHPELAMFRGALEDLSFPDWILRLVGAKRSVVLDDDNIAAARWTMIELLAAGVTTVAATEMTGVGAAAMTEAGMRGILYQEVFGPDPAQRDASIGALESAVEGLRGRVSELVRIGVSPHAPYTVSDDLYAATAKLAEREGLPMAVHIAESRAERELVTAGAGPFAPGLNARGILTEARGRSSIALLDRLGVLDRRPLLIHCVDVDAEDIAMIARADAPVAHCPVANARLGHGVAPYREMREAGITVGLGTDSVGSNNRLDLIEEARVASILQRARLQSSDAMAPAELLELCTIEGARALGLDEVVGSLEPGKAADFCVVGLEAPATVPATDPVATLFHAARGSDVRMTAVNGKILYQEGTFTTLDLPSTRTALDRAAERVRSARKK